VANREGAVISTLKYIFFWDEIVSIRKIKTNKVIETNSELPIGRNFPTTEG
jgi:hypothetical protein